MKFIFTIVEIWIRRILYIAKRSRLISLLSKELDALEQQMQRQEGSNQRAVMLDKIVVPQTGINK